MFKMSSPSLSLLFSELQNINDVEYLRKTLSVEKSEEEALQYCQVTTFHTKMLPYFLYDKPSKKVPACPQGVRIPLSS